MNVHYCSLPGIKTIFSTKPWVHSFNKVLDWFYTDIVWAHTRRLKSKSFVSAAAGESGQRQGCRLNGIHLRHGPLWKNPKGLQLLWDSLHPESHLGAQRPRWDASHQSRIWRWVTGSRCVSRGLAHVLFGCVFPLQVMAYPQFLWLWLAEATVWVRWCLETRPIPSSTARLSLRTGVHRMSGPPSVCRVVSAALLLSSHFVHFVPGVSATLTASPPSRQVWAVPRSFPPRLPLSLLPRSSAWPITGCGANWGPPCSTPGCLWSWLTRSSRPAPSEVRALLFSRTKSFH